MSRLPRLAALALMLCGCDGSGDERARETETDAPAAAAERDPDVMADRATGTAPPTAADVAAPPVAADPAPVKESASGFPEGLCDEVYEFRFHGAGGPGTPYLVQPGGEYHPTVQFDAPWGDETTQAVAYRPLIDNKKVTHHFIFMAGTMNWLDAWAPGNEDPPLPDDVGMELPKGKRALALNMHYYNLTGSTAEPDQSGLAVCAVRGAHLRKKAGAVHGFAAVKFPMVPANAKGHVLSSSCKATVKEPVTLFSMGPHAHKLGRHMKLTVAKPDGRVLTLHDGSFAFEEQATIPLSPPYVVENGDNFTVSCTFDNDSNKAVQFGENTDDEMCFNFVTYAPKGALNCGLFSGLTGGTAR